MLQRWSNWLHPGNAGRGDSHGYDKTTTGRRVNRAAAQYWSRHITAILSVEDGLQALEAYYHLMAPPQDYEGRGIAVLLQSRHNQWQQFLPLASSLYRMGLFATGCECHCAGAAFLLKKEISPTKKPAAAQRNSNNILGAMCIGLPDAISQCDRLYSKTKPCQTWQAQSDCDTLTLTHHWTHPHSTTSTDHTGTLIFKQLNHRFTCLLSQNADCRCAP